MCLNVGGVSFIYCLYAAKIPLCFCRLSGLFTMNANDRGYGLGRAAGEFPVAMATKEMRAQRLPEAHQPPKAHRRVLWVCSLILSYLVSFQVFRS
jgi:hypothetical protein